MNRILALFVMYFVTLLTSNANAINSKAIRDTSEEFLYGTKVISHILLDDSLKEIAKPETNCIINLSRKSEEADQLIQKFIPSINQKLSEMDSPEFFSIKKRMSSLLNILEYDFNIKELEDNIKISLSFLLESIEEKL